jgi:hypothetical protein
MRKWVPEEKFRTEYFRSLFLVLTLWIRGKRAGLSQPVCRIYTSHKNRLEISQLLSLTSEDGAQLLAGMEASARRRWRMPSRAIEG